MKSIRYAGMAALAAIMLSGCACKVLNKVDLTMPRNTTVGRELIDLQAAHEKGVINDTEYAKARNEILSMVESVSRLNDNKD